MAPSSHSQAVLCEVGQGPRKQNAALTIYGLVQQKYISNIRSLHTANILLVETCEIQQLHRSISQARQACLLETSSDQTQYGGRHQTRDNTVASLHADAHVSDFMALVLPVRRKDRPDFGEGLGMKLCLAVWPPPSSSLPDAAASAPSFPVPARDGVLTGLRSLELGAANLEPPEGPWRGIPEVFRSIFLKIMLAVSTAAAAVAADSAATAILERCTRRRFSIISVLPAVAGLFRSLSLLATASMPPAVLADLVTRLVLVGEGPAAAPRTCASSEEAEVWRAPRVRAGAASRSA